MRMTEDCRDILRNIPAVFLGVWILDLKTRIHTLIFFETKKSGKIQP